MPLPKDRWPNIYFYDVRTDKKVKVNIDDVKLKSGSTKGHGPGKYFQAIAVEPGRLKYNLYKFINEEKYNDFKEKMKEHKKKSKSKKSKSKSRSPCNMTKSGKKITKKQCSKKKTCSWVKGKRSGMKSRKGYCRKN